MPAPRPLSAHPNLRYFKLEAKRRLRAGEFGTLHEAQQAIAREHGLPGWPAFRRHIDSRRGAESGVLPHLRWVISRFRNVGEPGWAQPDEDELREHFGDDFLAAIPAHKLIAAITGNGVDLSREPVVTARTPLAVRLRIADFEVHANAESGPRHRISSLCAIPVGARITATRTPPRAIGTRREIPAAVAGIADAAVADLGLTGLVLAGQAGQGDGAAWTTAIGWADLGKSEPMTAGHRFPAHEMSVLITAVAVLRLVADGSAGLDDPANDHLRTVTLADSTLTIRELCSPTPPE